MKRIKRLTHYLFILLTVIVLAVNLFAAGADPDDEPAEGGQAQQQGSATQPARAASGDADDNDDGVNPQSTANQPARQQDNAENTAVPEKTLKFSGEFFGDLSMGLKRPNKFHRQAAQLRFAVEARFMSVQFYGQIEVAYDTSRENVMLNGETITDATRYLRMREVWAEWETLSDREWFSRFAIKVGRIIYNWGKGDEVRPSDILNPQDYSNFSFSELNDRKIPVWSLSLDLKIHEAWRWNFIFIPIHHGAEIPKLGHPYANPLFAKMEALGITTFNLSAIEKKLNNSAYAVKTYFKVLDVDFSIGYFSGYDTVPTTDGLTTQIEMSYKYLRMIAFDFEFVLGGLGWRGEFAYYGQGKHFYQYSNTSIERKFISSVFGFDKHDLFIKGIYLNIQMIGEFILNHGGNNIIAKKTLIGFSMNLSYEILNWKFEIGGVYIIQNKELMIKPKITWKVQNDFNIMLGVNLVFGKDEYEYSQAKFGMFNHRSFVFMQLKYSF